MKTPRAILFAFLLLVPSVLWAQSKGEMPFTSSSPDAIKLLRQSWVAYADQKIEEGNNLAKQAVEKDPDCAVAYLSLFTTNVEQRNENLKKAEGLKLSTDEKLFLDGIKANQARASVKEFFDPLLTKYPKDDYLHLIILFNYRDVKRRVEIAEAVIKRNPKFAPAYNMVGYAYMEQQEMTKAETSFNKYISLRPDLANVYDSKGDYMMRVGNFKEATTLFEKASSMGMSTSAVKAQRAAARGKYPKPSENDLTELKRIITASSEEFVKGNVDGFLKYYADQSIEIYGNQIANVGITNLRQRVGSMFKNISYTKLDCTPKAIDGAGSIAMSWGPVTSSVKTNSTGQVTESKGNVIILFRKQSDGTWKILADHFFDATTEENTEDVAKVRQVLTNWNAALRAGEVSTEKDHEALAAQYSPQAIELLPSQRSNVGIANILTRWTPLTGFKWETNSLGPIGVEVIGRRAVAWGVAVQNFYQKGSEVLTKNQFPWGMILTKEKDDVWRILAIHWSPE